MSSVIHTSENIASTKTASALVTGRPSIFQQRIILIVFLGIVGALVWWQGTNGNANQAVQKFSMTPIAGVATDLDFTIAEAAWSDLQIDPKGNLKINTQLESALVEAITFMQDQTSEQQMARMALLLEKQFGATASQEFMTLLPTLKNYKEIEQRWLEKNSSNNLSANQPLAYVELFQLQDELLGKDLAEKMFSDQRQLAKMMSASLKIRNDTTLTEAEKNQAMMDLQTRPQENPDEDAISE